MRTPGRFPRLPALPDIQEVKGRAYQSVPTGLSPGERGLTSRAPCRLVSGLRPWRCCRCSRMNVAGHRSATRSNGNGSCPGYCPSPSGSPSAYRNRGGAAADREALNVSVSRIRVELLNRFMSAPRSLEMPRLDRRSARQGLTPRPSMREVEHPHLVPLQPSPLRSCHHPTISAGAREWAVGLR